MDMWFDSDICWCADSDACGHIECFRHWDNKPMSENVFNCGHLMGTEYCLMYEEGEK